MTVLTGDNPVKTVEVLGDKYILNQAERATILRHFIMTNDFTAFGLVKSSVVSTLVPWMLNVEASFLSSSAE